VRGVSKSIKYGNNVKGNQMARDMKIHVFRSTGEAYDACNCDDNVKTGDILIVPSEGVVGIADTWPFSITPNRGKFHTLKDESDPSNDRFRPSIEFARKHVAMWGWTDINDLWGGD
jgi:hypothetical protein